MKSYKGKTIFEGFANGEIKVLSAKQEIKERQFTDMETELSRFLSARDKEVAKLDKLYQDTKAKLGEDKAKLFETHKIMATDPDFEDSVKQFLETGNIAEKAVDLADVKESVILPGRAFVHQMDAERILSQDGTERIVGFGPDTLSVDGELSSGMSEEEVIEHELESFIDLIQAINFFGMKRI